MTLINTLKQKLLEQKSQHQINKKIVFSESEDTRILEACLELSEQQLITPVLIGNVEKIRAQLQQLNATVANNVEIIEPQSSPHLELFATQLYEKRKKKGMTLEQAQQGVTNALSFSYLLLNNGFVDGAINGALNTTAEVVRKAIQIIGLHPHSSIVSSYFIMSKENDESACNTLFFADCALVINPDSQQLSQIGFDTITNAQKLLDEPVKAAMLSFSTQNSARHPEAIKVNEATTLLKKHLPDLAIDGEIQFDAAVSPAICAQKYQNSTTQGAANVFIFPNLSAGNIGYKIAQRLGGYAAIGPILQGLNKPANDLSRGCSVEDIINLAIVTAL